MGSLARPHSVLVLFKRGHLGVPDVSMVSGSDMAAVELAHGLYEPGVIQIEWRSGVGNVAALAGGGPYPT